MQVAAPAMSAHTISDEGNAVLHITRHRDRKTLALSGTLRERFEAQIATAVSPDNVCAVWMDRYNSILLRRID